MTLIDSINALLRRPTPSPAAASTPAARRKAVADAATAEGHLVDALSQLDEQVHAQQLFVANGADELEKLRAEGARPAAIREHRDKIDDALYEIDTLTQRRPPLARQLSILRFEQDREAWTQVRDAEAEFCRALLLPAIKTYRDAVAEWSVRYHRVLERFPDAVQILPKMPGLYDGNPSFAEQIERFAQMERQLAKPQPPLFYSLGACIEAAVQTGRVPEGVPHDWRVNCERAMSGTAKIEFTVNTLDEDGRDVKSGTEKTLPYAEADRLVTSGRARYV